jgi:hypothetical protein
MNKTGIANADSILRTGSIYANFGKATEAQKEADKELAKANEELEAAKTAADELEEKTAVAAKAAAKAKKAKEAEEAAAEDAKAAAKKAGILGGKNSRKKGGDCTPTNRTLLSIIDNYIIDPAIISAHPIFTNLNNNIIFVFSDVMYLNKYLNTNLNKKSFQENMQDKINKLTTTYMSGSANISMKNLLQPSFNIKEEENKSYRDLIKQMHDYIDDSNQTSKAKLDEKINSVNLNRNIDGMYDIDKGIINHHLIREKYSFMYRIFFRTYT